MLKPGEKFQGYEEPAKKYEKDIYVAYELCKEKYTFDTLVIFGELFGGHYNHKDVPKNKTATKIQGRISYTPTNDFMLFDIMLRTGVHGAEGYNEKWLSQEEVDYVVSNLELLKHVPILNRGKLNDFIELGEEIKPLLPMKFITTVPSTYKLPEIDLNYAEGYVLRPAHIAFFDTGSRVIIKMKNDDFSEIKSSNIKFTFDEKELEAYESISDYLTKERLMSVLSKLPDDKKQKSKKNINIILSQLINDAFEDFVSDKELEVNTDIKKHVLKKMGKTAYKIVFNYFDSN